MSTKSTRSGFSVLYNSIRHPFLLFEITWDLSARSSASKIRRLLMHISLRSDSASVGCERHGGMVVIMMRGAHRNLGTALQREELTEDQLSRYECVVDKTYLDQAPYILPIREDRKLAMPQVFTFEDYKLFTLWLACLVMIIVLPRGKKGLYLPRPLSANFAVRWQRVSGFVWQREGVFGPGDWSKTKQGYQIGIGYVAKDLWFWREDEQRVGEGGIYIHVDTASPCLFPFPLSIHLMTCTIRWLAFAVSTVEDTLLVLELRLQAPHKTDFIRDNRSKVRHIR